MAVSLSSTINNITEYPNSFKRQGAFPLERYEVFTTKADAEAYAASNPIAYVGQTVKVDTGSGVEIYKINDAAGTLVRIDGVSESETAQLSAAAAITQMTDGDNASIASIYNKLNALIAALHGDDTVNTVSV